MSDLVITEYAREFSAAWPEVLPRLRSRLRRQGVDNATVDDAVQETALRALSVAVPFSSPDDLLAWSTVVARRIVIADQRKSRRNTDPVHEATHAPVDVEQEVIARDALRRVTAAVTSLAASDRAALASVPAALSRTDAVRENVRRHRARQRLRAIAGAAWGTAFALARRLRSDTPDAIALAGTALMSVTLSVSAMHPATVEHTSDATRSAVSAASSAALAREAPRAMVPPVAQVTASPRVTAGRTDGGGRHGVIPTTAIEVPTPTGQPGRFDGRDQAPTELSNCLRAGPGTEVCVAVPVPPTPLDEL